MKIRMGFVSNSSSSSYTCDVCGDVQSGWDICLAEANMHQCVNGHAFCDSHLREPVPENVDANEFRYQVPKEFCPICMLESIPPYMQAEYLLHKNQTNSKSINEEIKSSFKDYDDFYSKVKNVRPER